MSPARAWADHPDLVAYYASHRNRPDELYPSERRFLPELARASASVLDVGCGAGGFSSIWRAFNPALRYVGADLSAALVRAARHRHPDLEFVQADCADGLPFADGAFDCVAALGWLHWEPRYEVALRELWRVSARSLFFDLRLSGESTEAIVGAQRLALTGDWDGHTTVPYICAPWPGVARCLLELGPSRVRAHGYLGEPADTVTGVGGQVCFATFVLERTADSGGYPPELGLELPLDWPAELASAIRSSGR